MADLIINKEVVMTDSRQVVDGIAYDVKDFYGDCLIAGLGIGHSSRCLLLNPKVRDIDVVEIEQGIIDRFAVAGTNVICADIFDFVNRTDKHYDNAYLCIWHKINNTTYAQIKKLRELTMRISDNIVAWKEIYAFGKSRRQ